MEVTFLHQRLISLEDRFATLESMLARTISKLDGFVSKGDNEARLSESLRIRMDGMEEENGLMLKSTRDMSQRVLSFERRVESLSEMPKQFEERASRLEDHLTSLTKRHEELSRIVRRNAEASDATTASVRSSIAQATSLLKVFTVRQCEALSTETAARLDTFEKDRSELVQQIASVANNANETRIGMADVKALVAQSDITFRRHEVALGAVAEDVKVLQRRFLSALRHLSHEPASYLSAPTDTSPVRQGRIEEKRPLTEAKSPQQQQRESLAKPLGSLDDDSDLDQFIAELNFLTRNAS